MKMYFFYKFQFQNFSPQIFKFFLDFSMLEQCEKWNTLTQNKTKTSFFEILQHSFGLLVSLRKCSQPIRLQPSNDVINNLQVEKNASIAFS